MAYAPEYTDEMSKGYLDSLTQGIDDLGRQDEGRAIAEQAARGTLGQETADSAVGAVRTGVRNQKSSTIGQFNMAVADKKYSERMGEKSRGWQVEDRDFGAAEAEKDRAFREKMAQLGYQFEDGQRQKNSEFNAGGFLSGVAGNAISAYAGGYAGRKG